MLEETAYSSLPKSPSTNGGPPAGTALAFLCHLDDSVLGREATDLTGKSGKDDQSSRALPPRMSALLQELSWVEGLCPTRTLSDPALL